MKYTRKDLDELVGTRNMPGCKHEHGGITFFGLRARCHPNAPAFAIYVSERGTMMLMCAVCKDSFAEVQVAGALPS